MANVPHASLTGSELHEPKGVATAALGTVYVSNGSGSGSWTDVGTASFTGMIADFLTPVAPAGWIECNGSTISTSTYNALYNVMSLQITGTRSSGSPVVTSLSSVVELRIGYYAFGTGIASGTTIVSIDSATQITLSNNAGSSGTANISFSPWLLNTGTIQLPDMLTAGRFRRSRSNTTVIGQAQTNQNLSHTHGVSGTTGLNSNDHTHSYSGTTGLQNANHQHSYVRPNVGGSGATGGGNGNSLDLGTPVYNEATGIENQNHGHAYSGVTTGISANHSHAFSTTSAADGGTEARPNSLVVMTCVKT